MSKFVKYKTGMYGGSFDPLHLGHIHNIIRAAAMCDELYVIISWSEGRESTSKEMRKRWIEESFSHMSNIHVLLLEDTAATKEEFNTDYYWEKGAQDIKALVGKPIDIVFCGSDYLGTNRFESLYCPESIVHYFDRREIPISSTDIRRWALENWKYIPRLCKPFYAKKVLIIGSGGSGKTTLSNNLALAYNTVCVPSVCKDAFGSSLTAEDMIGHFAEKREMIDRVAGDCNRILFADTADDIFAQYSEILLGEDASDRISDADFDCIINDVRSWDLALFLGTDEDCAGSNDGGSMREKIRLLFEKHNVRFEVLSGDYLQRFNKAKAIIEEYLGVTSSW